MKLDYYPIHGRGERGDKFQLARIQDEAGNYYKGAFDQARHFDSEGELREYLASEVLKVDAASIELKKMNL